MVGGQYFPLWTEGGKATSWKDDRLIEKTAVRNFGNDEE